jgi:hypothetical protein
MSSFPPIFEILKETKMDTNIDDQVRALLEALGIDSNELELALSRVRDVLRQSGLDYRMTATKATETEYPLRWGVSAITGTTQQKAKSQKPPKNAIPILPESQSKPLINLSLSLIERNRGLGWPIPDMRPDPRMGGSSSDWRMNHG